MFSFHRLARIDATAGLQISQPWPVPCAAIRASNVLIRLILTISNSSWRLCGKCSQRWLLTFLPIALSSALSRSVTCGRQPPQPVPALVHVLTSATVVSPFVADGVADLALADVVARADLGVGASAAGGAAACHGAGRSTARRGLPAAACRS